MFFYDWLYILLGVILIPGLILGIVAQSKVKTTYSKYSKIFANKSIPANKMVRTILDTVGLQDIQVIKIKGELTDHYNPKEKILALSSGVYDSSSLSALGIAAHELGHALQDKDKYKPMIIRNIFGTASKIGSWLLLPTIIIALILGFMPLGTESTLPTIIMAVGVGYFGISVIFSLITLPIEINASKRTEQLLVKTGLLDESEFECVKKVLRAAAWTYIASLVISILSLLRFVVWFLAMFGKKD